MMCVKNLMLAWAAAIALSAPAAVVTVDWKAAAGSVGTLEESLSAT